MLPVSFALKRARTVLGTLSARTSSPSSKPSGPGLPPSSEFALGKGGPLGLISEHPALLERVKQFRGKKSLPAGLIGVLGQGGSGKSTFLRNISQSNNNSSSLFITVGEPVLDGVPCNYLDMSSVIHDLIDIIISSYPTAFGTPNEIYGWDRDKDTMFGSGPGFIKKGMAVYVDSLTELVNYTELGATTGGYGRDLGDIYYIMQWLAYAAGVLLVGTVNPFSSRDEHFDFVFNSIENKALAAIVLSATADVSQVFVVNSVSSTSQRLMARFATLHVREIARNDRAIKVQLS